MSIVFVVSWNINLKVLMRHIMLQVVVFKFAARIARERSRIAQKKRAAGWQAETNCKQHNNKQINMKIQRFRRQRW